MNIKKGDNVMVLAGKDKGKSGKVLQVLRSEGRVVIEGINLSKVHKKKTSAKAGAIIEVATPIDASNVNVIDPQTKKPTRVKHKMINDKKIRVGKSGQELK